MHVTSLLCLCVRVYVVATDTDIPSICNNGQFATRGKQFWNAFYIGENLLRGAFFLGGFLTGGLKVRWLLSGGFLPGFVTQNLCVTVEGEQNLRHMNKTSNTNMHEVGYLRQQIFQVRKKKMICVAPNEKNNILSSDLLSLKSHLCSLH